MKSVLKALNVSALAALLVAGTVAQSAAAPIVSISPVTQTVGLNAAFSVDILVSGLDGTAAGAVGGFSALLSFDNALLDGVSYVVDPDAKMGVALDAINDASGGFVGGTDSPLDLFFIADVSLDGTALAALQGTGFRLATINFMSGVIEGLSALALSVRPPAGALLSDPLGVELDGTSANGSVCVSRDGGQGPCTGTVPEPGLLALLATGLATAAFRRRAVKG